MMKTIAEQIVDYYNKEINKSGTPVTLEWLRRQRIIERRVDLNIKFGQDSVDTFLGKITYLAEAGEFLNDIEYRYCNYKSLPKIASLLSKECKTVLEAKNPIREKYSYLEFRIPIPFFNSISSSKLSFTNFESPSERYIPVSMLDTIYNSYAETFKTNPCLCFFYEYLQKAAYHSLKIAFDEIKAEVIKVTK